MAMKRASSTSSGCSLNGPSPTAEKYRAPQLFVWLIEEKLLVRGELDTRHAKFFFKLARGRLHVAFISLHHATGGNVPVARIDCLAQGAPMHAQLPGRVEQQDICATTDQTALTQLRTRQGAEQLVLTIDPGNQF